MTAPPVADLLAGLRVVAIPMAVPFRGITTREVALIEGPAGWGEFGPFPEYEPPEAARWLAAAIESAYAAWPAPVRCAIAVNATVPAVPADRVPAILARFPGCTTVKVKIAQAGQHLADDIRRVERVRRELGPDARIRLDANGALTVGEAALALKALAAFDIDYVEQPVATLAELRALRAELARARVEMRVAADEAIRKADDPLRVDLTGLADLLVLKVAPSGGIRRALRIVAAHGLPVVVSSALDTSIGIAAGAALAAALPELDGACGLGTLALMDGDVCAASMTATRGWVVPRRVSPDEDLLDRYAAPPDQIAWWRRRVVACHEHLGRADAR